MSISTAATVASTISIRCRLSLTLLTRSFWMLISSTAGIVASSRVIWFRLLVLAQGDLTHISYSALSGLTPVSSNKSSPVIRLYSANAASLEVYSSLLKYGAWSHFARNSSICFGVASSRMVTVKPIFSITSRVRLLPKKPRVTTIPKSHSTRVTLATGMKFA